MRLIRNSEFNSSAKWVSHMLKKNIQKNLYFVCKFHECLVCKINVSTLLKKVKSRYRYTSEKCASLIKKKVIQVMETLVQTFSNSLATRLGKVANWTPYIPVYSLVCKQLIKIGLWNQVVN